LCPRTRLQFAATYLPRFVVMTESVSAMDQDAVRAAMQAELDGVDAIARFRFDDDFNIYSFGQTIDAIPNASPGLTASLRKVVYAFDEPDTHAEAFQSTPSLSFPQSQERYKALQERLNYDEYLQFISSQSQQIGTQAQSQSQSTTQAASTPSAFRAPPCAQPFKLQIPNREPGGRAGSGRKHIGRGNRSASLVCIHGYD
ncbi:hypothetical protein CF328_g7916, partial [Tilletia controversa]